MGRLLTEVSNHLTGTPFAPDQSGTISGHLQWQSARRHALQPQPQFGCVLGIDRCGSTLQPAIELLMRPLVVAHRGKRESLRQPLLRVIVEAEAHCGQRFCTREGSP